ncbi:hypothetical protein CHS0354_011439 [Potamilus streckersoni]|uniref:RRM domain-containing protein n=1 Tax=Potamilus streckersoni TaxID=2493646 RepID=A0AAE0SLB9_9BIVA|nr:hypothetical protein CHS0354_011439 [Potamilus streckersoni]
MAENGDIDQQTEERLLAEDDMENGHSEDYHKLVDYGIDKNVAAELEEIYKTGKLSHSDLDDRALDALKEFPPNDAIAVLKQFCESSLEHVGNKSAYLCGQMKTFRQKSKGGGANAAPKPDEAKLKEILDRTGYSLDVTTGQRKYGGPPPNWDGAQPGPGHEVFCGKIPKDVFEDELIPLFEKCGTIWDLRLMMDPLSGYNRGYCFVTFCNKKGAEEAVKQLDDYAIKPGKKLKVNISVANQRLFVGNIPKSKTRDEIIEEFSTKTEGLIDVIIYRSAEKENQKNRGFAFLHYDSHKTASTAKRKLSSGRTKVWGCDIIVDWADPIDEPDGDTMQKVKVLYVRNLTSDVTEEMLKSKFEEYGKVERVKKIKDYGFVHFEEREHAVVAMEALNGEKFGKLEIEVSLAKPPSENKKKEHRKMAQERRQMMMMVGRGAGYDDYWGLPGRMPPPGPYGGYGPRGGMRRPVPPPPEYYDDFYYEDDYYYYGGYAPPMRGGRGARGGPMMPPPSRGRGGVPPPPRGGPRGAPVAAARGSRGSARGRGGVGGAGRGRGGAFTGGGQQKPQQQQQQPRGGKRKAPIDANQGQSKRRNINEWGAQPIAQQPLGQSGYGGNYSGNDSQWYTDSYGQNWG